MNKKIRALSVALAAIAISLSVSVVPVLAKKNTIVITLKDANGDPLHDELIHICFDDTYPAFDNIIESDMTDSDGKVTIHNIFFKKKTEYFVFHEGYPLGWIKTRGNSGVKETFIVT